MFESGVLGDRPGRRTARHRRAGGPFEELQASCRQGYAVFTATSVASRTTYGLATRRGWVKKGPSLPNYRLVMSATSQFLERGMAKVARIKVSSGQFVVVVGVPLDETLASLASMATGRPRFASDPGRC